MPDRATPATSIAFDAAPSAATRDNSLWVLAARPTAVIGGGLLLALLAVALLFIGQRDETGTLVMLAICASPLALLIIVIGLIRALLRAAGRG
jgi:hypothetical protein